MMNKHGKAEIENVKYKNPVILEVNFDDEFKDCVQLTLGEEQAVVRYSDLFSFMFIIASKEQQAKMVPVREELGHQYMKQIHVRLKKDMKEGEEMVVNVPINVPQVIEDAILAEKESPELSPYSKDLTEDNKE